MENLEDRLVRIRDQCKRFTGSKIASIWLYDREKKTIKLAKKLSSDGKHLSFSLNQRAIVTYIAQTKKFVISEDVREEPYDKKGTIYNQESEKTTGVKIRQLMGVPITTKKGELLGVIQVMNSPSGYSSIDAALLQGFAAYTAKCIENKSISEIDSMLLEMGKLIEAIHRAANFQSRMIPNAPDKKEFDIAFMHLPCGNLGKMSGDWYFAKANGNLEVIIGDVAGHDIDVSPIAISCLSTTKTLLNLPLFSGKQGMTEFLKNLNKNHPGECHSTLAYARFYPNGMVDHLLAAQHPPMIFDKKGCFKSQNYKWANNKVLGSFTEEEFLKDFENPSSHKLEEGDVYIAFTDGVQELISESRGFYGRERIIDFFSKLIKANPRKKASKIVQYFKRELNNFAGFNFQRNDDITVAVVKYLGGIKNA